MDIQTLFESQKRAHWQQAKGHLMAQMHSGALVFHVFEDSDETP